MLSLGVRQRDIRLQEVLERHRNSPKPHYQGFFDCFNRGLYFEAHEVLEQLWLRSPGVNYHFYKGLIQLAGAFVHVQKGRREPALALLDLAAGNLCRYPPFHDGLAIESIINSIQGWRTAVKTVPDLGPALLDECAPRLELLN